MVGPKVFGSFLNQKMDPTNKADVNISKTEMQHRPVDRTVLEGKSIVLFRAAIKSSHTLDPYERRLCTFLHHVKMGCDQFVRFAKKNPKKAESIIIQYAIKNRDKLYEREESKKPAACTIVNRLKPVKLLLDINDVEGIKWRKIKRFLPQQRRFAVDRIPTIEEIRRIYDVCDIWGKALLLLLLSSGIREGAIENLSVKHLQPVERDGAVVAARLAVYQGEPEEYVTFLTPEAYRSVQNYLDYRRSAGETIGPDSSLIRDTFRYLKYRTESPRIKNPKRCMPQMIRHYFNRLLAR